MALGPMALASKVQSLAWRCLEAEFYGLGTHGLGLEGPVLGLEVPRDMALGPMALASKVQSLALRTEALALRFWL